MLTYILNQIHQKYKYPQLNTKNNFTGIIEKMKSNKKKMELILNNSFFYLYLIEQNKNKTPFYEQKDEDNENEYFLKNTDEKDEQKNIEIYNNINTQIINYINSNIQKNNIKQILEQILEQNINQLLHNLLQHTYIIDLSIGTKKINDDINNYNNELIICNNIQTHIKEKKDLTFMQESLQNLYGAAGGTYNEIPQIKRWVTNRINKIGKSINY